VNGGATLGSSDFDASSDEAAAAGSSEDGAAQAASNSRFNETMATNAIPLDMVVLQMRSYESAHDTSHAAYFLTAGFVAW
jgi:hypothetical protein